MRNSELEIGRVYKGKRGYHRYIVSTNRNIRTGNWNVLYLRVGKNVNGKWYALDKEKGVPIECKIRMTSFAKWAGEIIEVADTTLILPKASESTA